MGGNVGQGLEQLMATVGAWRCPWGATRSEAESPQIQGAVRLPEGGEMQRWGLGSNPASSNLPALPLLGSVTVSPPLLRGGP